MRRTELLGSREGWTSGSGVRRVGLLALALFVAACSDGTQTTDPDTLPIGGILADHNPGSGDPGQCFGDDAVTYSNLVSGMGTDPEEVNCTANDIDIAIAIVGGVEGIPNYQPGDPVQCAPGPGSTITLNMSAQLVQNANSDRQDIGVWIGTGQASAVTGECRHYFLDTDLAGTFNGDNTAEAPDHCAGMSVGASATLPLGNITVPCAAVTTDPPGDLQGPGTYLQVGACIGWKIPGADTQCPDNQANDGVAITPEDFRAGTLLANKSKCNCEPFFIPLIIPGTITINKDAVPNSAQDFQFNTTGGGNLPASFFLDDDADGTLPSSRTFNNLTPGTFTVTEAADPAGWQFGSLSCTSTGAGTSTSTASKTATITLAGGGVATCTYVNNGTGSITVTKDAVPNDAQDFQFNTTGGSTVPASFFLDDDADGTLPNTRTFTTVAAGTYTVTEAADPTGWQFGTLSCTNSGGATSTSTAGKVATITLAPGGSASCTYTNNKQGSITITKDAVPNAAQDFQFNTTGGSTVPASFFLDDDADGTLPNTRTFTNVALGTYTVTEAADPAGWAFASLSCTNSGGTTSTSTAAKVATITIGAGGSASCTYTNNGSGSITITKDAVPNDAQDFQFNTTGGSTVPASFFLDDDADGTLPNTRTFTTVAAGTYTVTEAADPTGWQFGSLSCTNSGGATSTSTAAKVATITLAPGGSASCTYTNNKQGSITITKDAVPNGAQDFQFNTTGGGTVPASFFLDDDADGTLPNTRTFTNVPLGTYTVTEAADPAGWAFGSLSCTNSGGTTSTSTAGKVATITIGAGGTASCTYVNNELGTIIIEKETSDGSNTQIFSFTRRISPSTSDAGDNPNPTMTDGGSSSSGKKLAAGTYRVCEVNLAAGWQDPTVTVNGVLTALSVADATTGTFCVQVVMTGGETDIVEFTNTPPPGGGTRTIGYWMNHASCSESNGNQYQKTIDAGFPNAVLDPHINNATDPFYTSNPIGVFDGTPLLTCEGAVNLLQKETVTGEKRPGDPIYNMVSQMVGAKLNLAAGAGTCTALNTALAAASAYLVSIGFDGTGSYKDTISDADKALVLGWAATFASYNEGTLGGGCPTHV
jgi:hypothetical protein